MLFLSAFLSGELMSIPCTPTDCSNLTALELKNGNYDTLFITKNCKDKISPDFPDGWDFDTIFYAKFDNNANAGNVDWSLDTVSHVLIKRREKNDFKWHVLSVKEISKKEDFLFQGTDFTNAAKTEYEYAVVPTFHGIEGNYDSIMVNSDFEDIFLVGENGVIHTSLTDGYCDMSKNIPSSSITTIYSKYPTRIRNTKADYYSGSFRGSFVSYSVPERDFIVEDKQRTRYQQFIIDFLSDGRPKLLKHFDSRMALISIDEAIQNNANGHYQNRDISFNFTETGDFDSEKDLYNHGLLDVTEEWW